MQNRIFSTDSAKASKSVAYGYLDAIQYMSPANSADGTFDLCPFKSVPCFDMCLGLTSGQAGIVKDLDNNADQGNATRKSRRDKAIRFMRDRAAYMRDVVKSVEACERKAKRLGLKLAVRPNGSQDISWEGIACERNGVRYRNLMEAFPHLPWLDYTKNPYRFNKPLPPNYHLTFSFSGTNEAKCLELLVRGVNVAVVFGAGLPVHWHGFTVIDGDKHDLRHLDPRGRRGYVIGLSPKGRKAKRDTSGFVVRA